MPYLVRDRLFFGDISDAAEALQGGNSSGGGGGGGGGGITHVLSILSSASISFFSEWRPGLSIPAEEIRKVFAGAGESPKKSLAPEKLLYSLERVGREMKLVRMAVPLRDTEDENLLDYLDVCLDFIDQGRKEGSVLVHCFAGVSRSASIITAYLMRTEQKSLEDALESLREICEFISPNDGFLEQLKMFEEMGFKVETSSPMYKRFRLKILGQSYKVGEKIDRSIFEADPGLSPESKFFADVSKGDQRRSAYRCKKCRRILALQENVVSHVPGEGETSFEWQKRKGGNPLNRFQEQDCSSLFLEPLKWMASVEEGALEGKLSCIHCDARLGYFNWSGIQCSCGSWITPAFQIHKSKVDVSTI